MTGGIEGMHFDCVAMAQMHQSCINGFVCGKSKIVDRNAPINLKICIEICDPKHMPQYHTMSANKIKDNLLEAINLKDVIVASNRFFLCYLKKKIFFLECAY